ncbi:MAG: aminoacyl-tRNA hydrolase [Methylocystaceae bacterium]
MKLIVGLGNPGGEYKDTRHNVGFMVIDLLAAALKARTVRQRQKAAVKTAVFNDEPVLLIKPLTYMNLSGEAVAALLKAHRAFPSDLLVIYDDLDLSLGRVRIRSKGSSGGHKGMQSIISRIGSAEFARIRVGISHPGANEVIDHVLGPFSDAEMQIVEPALAKAREAALVWVSDGIEKAMNTYN